MIGQTLSHFKITAKLGEGGMGEVYRAEDTKLGRDVAIKVLPALFTEDSERLARFEREAKVLAALNHPNIAGIYEVGQQDQVHFLAMEMAEGQDLSTRLAQGAVPLEEALQIAMQMAEALEAAHDRGIVHRDLKPANVMVAPKGQVKVLDFGLAKAWESDADQPANLSLSPTLTAQMTQAGTLLGTAAYMSPEQARGENADRRADIWAFGTVLMEMLSGQKVFPGKTVSDSLAGILAREPEWNRLPSELPASIRRLLERCLEKEVSERLQAVGEARIAIERYLADPDAEAEATAAETVRAPGRSRLTLSATAVLAALAGGVAMWLATPEQPRPRVRKLHVPVESGLRSPTLSPDGTILAYVEDNELFIRPLDATEAQRVSHEQSVRNLFWSPDSEWIGFVSGNEIWKTPARGGTPQTIGPAGGNFGLAGGIGWKADGALLITEGSAGLSTMSSRGGEATEILAPVADLESDFHNASVLPDGRGVVFVVHSLGDDRGMDTLAVWDGEERKDVLHIAGAYFRGPAYAPSGHIVFTRRGDNAGVWALPFLLEDMEVTGEPFLVVANAHDVTVSSDGTLAYIRGSTSEIPESQLVWVDRSGVEIAPIGEPHTLRPILDLSPDDTRLVVETSDDDQIDLWIHDLERGTRARLTFEEGTQPVWSPDGESIVFSRREEGAGVLYIKRADGTDDRKRLTTGFEPTITPDGRWLLFNRVEQVFQILRLDLENPETEPVVVLDNARRPRLSPDGNFMAYASVTEGQPSQVLLTRFPEITGRWQISGEDGGWVHWRADGRELFYLTDTNEIMATPVELEPVVRVGTPILLFRRQPTGIRLPFDLPDRFAVSADGQRFVIAKRDADEAVGSPPITVVTNWFEEFREDSD